MSTFNDCYASTYQTNFLRVLYETKAELSMLGLLWTFYESECADLRDRIAALFGLLPAGNRFDMDYTRHWTE